MRIVLDTNVLVSALLFSGKASELVPLWQEGRVKLLLSRPILEEYFRVLAYPKFRLSPSEIKDLLGHELLPFVQIVRPRKRLAVVDRDPSDNKFVECAAAGRAGVLVSGDKHLLDLRKFHRLRIQSPSQFLAEFANEVRE